VRTFPPRPLPACSPLLSVYTRCTQCTIYCVIRYCPVHTCCTMRRRTAPAHHRPREKPLPGQEAAAHHRGSETRPTGARTHGLLALQQPGKVEGEERLLPTICLLSFLRLDNPPCRPRNETSSPVSPLRHCPSSHRFASPMGSAAPRPERPAHNTAAPSHLLFAWFKDLTRYLTNQPSAVTRSSCGSQRAAPGDLAG
jgi:hypothetical protein